MLKRKRGRNAPSDFPLPPPSEFIQKIPIAPEAPPKRSWKRRLTLGCFAVLAVCFACAFASIAATELGLLPDTRATHTVEAVTLQVAQRATATSEAATLQVAQHNTATSEAATATILALTPSSTPTITFTPSKTPRPTATETPTRTPTVTVTPTATTTRTPKPTEIPVTPWSRETYYTTTSANMRPCPNTSAQCAPIATLEQGAAFEVLGAVRGETVGGSVIWFKGRAGGRDGYVHSSILSANKPAPVRVVPPAAPRQAAPAAPAAPSGASAICNDGTYSFSAHRRGTCSHHGGVRSWLKSLPP